MTNSEPWHNDFAVCFQSSSIRSSCLVLDIDRVARATIKRAKTIGEKRVDTQLTPVSNRRIIRANWFAIQRTKDRYYPSKCFKDWELSQHANCKHG